MLKLLKAWSLWLTLALYGAPQVAQVILPAAQAELPGAAPAVLSVTPAALAGATAIIAAMAEDADAGNVTIHALNWDKNNADASSDIRLEWTGSGMIPRRNHTVIAQYNPHQQTGYYAVFWQSSRGVPWDNGAYAYGCHPWPADDCTTDGDGVGATPNSGSSAQCWEEAGMGHALDYLTTGGPSTGTTVVKNKWYTLVSRVFQSTGGRCVSGSYQHDFYYDYARDTSKVIHYCMVDTSGLASPTSPGFYLGGSNWEANQPSSGKNDETLAGKIRCIEQYDIGLTDADIATEAATCTNSASSTAGIAHLWYANADPIPSDVTDKSGAGHNPSWATANRPAQWDSTYAVPTGSPMLFLGAGGAH